MAQYCIFCTIIAGQAPAQLVHDGDGVLVFRNVLRWLPTMMLSVPKQHMEQEVLWQQLGAVGSAAAETGRRFCPQGYRLVSNFGWDALQSQPHAHVHILGGGAMEATTGALGESQLVGTIDGFRISERRTGWPPLVLVAEPVQPMTQFELWHNMEAIGPELVRLGKERCPWGFRLVSDVGWDPLQSQQQAHIYLLGGAELGHYI